MQTGDNPVGAQARRDSQATAMQRPSGRFDSASRTPHHAPSSGTLAPSDIGPESGDIRLDGVTVAAVNAFVSALVTGDLPIARVLLFGSRARGDFVDSSDIDVAVVMARPGGVSRMRADREMRRRTYWARAEYDFAVEPVVIWQESLAAPDNTHKPQFFRNVARDAIEWSWADAHS